ncbi:uncharacterized protein LOC111622205 [Centruroides sculpturatus]|uniref:uncharacterized protein LOC111622205 n=1 Tax=Centruroides sculpturatus TaxID=218467 RepID=UPI000C6EE5F2|nr:uncharacterized protein LOC111622205 [Centruroides sculpturatus]
MLLEKNLRIHPSEFASNKMLNVVEKGRFDENRVSVVGRNGQSFVLWRKSLIEKRGLLKNSVTLCPNESKFILKLSLTPGTLNQLVRFLTDKSVTFTSADDAFRMSLLGKRYHISPLVKIWFYYLVGMIYSHSHHVYCIHCLAVRHHEKQLQYYSF